MRKQAQDDLESDLGRHRSPGALTRCEASYTCHQTRLLAPSPSEKWRSRPAPTVLGSFRALPRVAHHRAMPRARRRVDSDAESDDFVDSPPRAGPSAKARGKRRAVSSDEDEDAERPVAPKKTTAVDKRRLSRAPLANSSSSTDLTAAAAAAPQGRASIGNGLPSGLQPGKMAALANAARRVTSGGRTSAGLIMPDAALTGLANPLAAAPPQLSNEQFEEWMKLATDGVRFLRVPTTRCSARLHAHGASWSPVTQLMNRKSTSRTRGVSRSSTTSPTSRSCSTRAARASTSRRPRARSTAASRSGRRASTRSRPRRPSS